MTISQRAPRVASPRREIALLALFAALPTLMLASSRAMATSDPITVSGSPVMCPLPQATQWRKHTWQGIVIGGAGAVASDCDSNPGHGAWAAFLNWHGDGNAQCSQYAAFDDEHRWQQVEQVVYIRECIVPIEQFYGRLDLDAANLGECKNCAVGNPINPATGNKFQQEMDYSGTGAFPLSFKRYYNSQDPRKTELGKSWRHTYSKRLRFYGDGPGEVAKTANYSSMQQACETGWPTIDDQAIGLAGTMATYNNATCQLKKNGVTVGTLPIYSTSSMISNPPIFAEREDGGIQRFSGANFVADSNVTARLEATTDGYRYIDDDVVEEYTGAGMLLSIKHRSGVTQTLSYVQSRLASVTDSFGRTLAFNYVSGRLQSVTGPAGLSYVYAYDLAKDVLSSVTSSGSAPRQYQYGHNSFPDVLTGITDENGDAFASWTYDDQGRAITSEHATGVEKVTLTFSAGGTTVQDALGATRTQTFQSINGGYHTNGMTRSCPSCSTGSTSSTFNPNGFIQSFTDYNGRTTRYEHNSRGLQTSRTEAHGTSLARQTTTTWHPMFRLPLQIKEDVQADGTAKRTTDYDYDDDGNRLKQTVTDPATGQSRVTSWTYNEFGQVESIDGPLLGAQDSTTYAYSADGSSNLIRITNALGHVTELWNYDGHGNPREVKDANGVVTTLSYDQRQRLTSRTTAGAITEFDYDDVGQLTKMTLPDGSYLRYEYDAAHRLIEIEDAVANRIVYGLDAIGNRISERIIDSSNALKRKQTREFDGLGRLDHIKDASNATVLDYDYDPQGNRISTTEAGSLITGTPVDALNRVSHVNAADGGETVYEYNALDQLTRVRDPKLLETIYTVNALGDIETLSSPDTGTTQYTYDAAGNRKTQTDARGITSIYSYDRLNRLTLIDYAGTAEDVTYYYDGSNYTSSIANGVGRLTGIQDESGTTTLIYDARGNVTQEQRVIGGAQYTTTYSYDDADRLTSITYPTGRLVTYQRNGLGQVSGVTTTVDGITTTLADSIAYMPFGGLKSYTLGNGVTVSRTYDQDYRIDNILDQAGTDLIQALSFVYDLRGNITTLADGKALSTQTLGYDALSRLTTVTGGSFGDQGFTYDSVGNRKTRSGLAPETYAHDDDSHRLMTLGSGTGFTYDAVGNTVAKGPLSLDYNAAARLTTISGGTVPVTNIYGARGQRTRKMAGAADTLFFYDTAARLIAEMDQASPKLREYVWLDDVPLLQAAVIERPEQIVDNSDAGFQSNGAWIATSDPAGFHGADYERHAATGGPQVVIVDDADLAAGASFSGAWFPSTCEGVWNQSGCHGVGYTYALSGIGDNVFTWRADLGQAGRYRVYARWVSYVDFTDGAIYSVTHAGGTAAITKSHRVDGGAWQLLGSYDFAAVGAQVTLRGSGPGNVIADAVRFVPADYAGPVTPESALWPAAAQSYEVFAKWPTSSALSPQAIYAISHAAGTTELVRNQRLGGGLWNALGTFTFGTASTQGIKLFADPDYPVAADAMRFVPVGDSFYATVHAYYHVDHLNTPRKMTDGDKAIVWEGNYEPFGTAVVTAQPGYENPLRFPGQYFDAETGLHQNWHRDYDPSIGRYLQSDPIGLGDGLNTYGYTGQNPVSWIDPTGLATYQCQRNLKGPKGLKIPRAGPLYHEYICTGNAKTGYSCGGLGPTGNPFDSPGVVEKDDFKPERCEKVQEDNKCIEDCITKKLAERPPNYSVHLEHGENCQTYSAQIQVECASQCKGKK